MRLTTVLLIASLLQVSAAGLAQKINLVKSNAALKTVLREIKAQSGYHFIITEDLLNKAKPVSIRVSNAELERVLDQIFKDQEMSYTIDSKTVLIKEKEQSYLEWGFRQ